MNYGSMVGDALAYAKDAVWGKWMKWLMLIIATIIIGIPLMGYTMKVLRGEKPSPEVTDWGTLFVDGIKYLVVAIIYCIPILIIGFLVLGPTLWTSMTSMSSGTVPAITGDMLAGILVLIIVAIIIAIFEIIGIVRLARTGSIGEAFNFNAILATIGKIGWGSYIIALIVLIIVAVIFRIIMTIIMLIPILGLIIYFCLISPFALFAARYVCLLYDSAGPAA